MPLPQGIHLFSHLVPSRRNCWEELGSVALLVEVGQWGQALRFQKTHAIPSVPSRSPTYRLRYELSAVSATFPLHYCHGLQPPEVGN